MEKLEIEELIKHFITDIKKDEATDILFNLVSDIQGLEKYRELIFARDLIFIHLMDNEKLDIKKDEIIQFLKPHRTFFKNIRFFITQDIRVNDISTKIELIEI